MYKYLELHNHTIESDGSLTTDGLVDLFVRRGVDAFAITDHNTTSGHRKLRQRLASDPAAPACIYGIEYTTYFGHLLCHDVDRYIGWEDLNYREPEPFFRRLKDMGGIIGAAHPFSYDAPLNNGCRWNMRVTDYGALDFVEVINNSESRDVNTQAVEWWESLVLAGWPLAATAGLDLHDGIVKPGSFGTFIEAEDGDDIHFAFRLAIQNRRTWVSRGPLPNLSSAANGDIIARLSPSPMPGARYGASNRLVLTLTSLDGVISRPCRVGGETIFPARELGNAGMFAVKLYDRAAESVPGELVAIAPPFCPGS